MMKTLSLFAVAAFSALAVDHNLTLSEVYGEVPRVESMEPWHKRSANRQARSEKYFSSRDADECDFALEIYILQDNTASFQDNYGEMKDTQLPLLVEAMNAQHPGTTFGIMSFRDKPIWSLGEPRSNDYCQRFESPISADDSLLSAVYDRLVSTGGGDPSENQFGALLAASQSSTPGWANPDAVKLIVLSTDAPPHFEGDGLNAYGMTTFAGTFDEANADAQCLGEYYPTPEQVKNALMAREAYLATIVFDGEWWSGLPSSSWAWFNSYIGQTDDFVEPLGNTATNFFESLSKVISAIKDIECAPESTQIPASADTTQQPTTEMPTTTTAPATEMPTTTTAPATEMPTTTTAPATEMPTTTAAPATEMPTTTTAPATEMPTTTTAPATEMPTTIAQPATTIAEGECPPCPQEPCPCNNKVFININVGFNPHDYQVQNNGQGSSQ